jgi:hypothetical protein
MNHARTRLQSHHLDTYWYILPNMQQNAVYALEDALNPT